MRTFLVGTVFWLLLGAELGAFVGWLISGDYLYVIAWSLGIGVIIAFALLRNMVETIGRGATPSRLAAIRARVDAGESLADAAAGINAQLAAERAAGTASDTTHTAQRVSAVLNPPPSTVPSAGVVLNGVPVGATSPGSTTAASPKPATTTRGSRSPAARTGLRLYAVVLLLAGAALALLPIAGLIGWVVADAQAGRLVDGRDMRTGLHQQEAVDAIVEVAGTTQFTRVGFYDGYVIADGLTAPGADTTDTYQWRYGRAFRDGPELIQSTDLQAELFDTSEVDFSIVGDLTREAMADVGWSEFESYYPSVIRDTDGHPVIMVSLSSPYEDATYTYSLDGELLERFGSAFD